MSRLAARRRRRAGGVEHRVDGLVRWQGAPRRGGGTWTVIALAAGLAALTLIAARTVGWLHWGSLLMIVPAVVLAAAFGAAMIALARRGLAWLAG